MFIKTTWMLPAVVTYVSLFILIISIPTMLRRPKWESLRYEVYCINSGDSGSVMFMIDIAPLDSDDVNAYV